MKVPSFPGLTIAAVWPLEPPFYLLVSWCPHLYNESVVLGSLLFLCQIVILSVQSRFLGHNVITKELKKALRFLNVCWCLVLVHWAKPFVLQCGIKSSLKYGDFWKWYVITQSHSSKTWKWLTVKAWGSVQSRQLGSNAGECPGVDKRVGWQGKGGWFIPLLSEIGRQVLDGLLHENLYSDPFCPSCSGRP